MGILNYCRPHGVHKEERILIVNGDQYMAKTCVRVVLCTVKFWSSRECKGHEKIEWNHSINVGTLDLRIPTPF